MSFEDHESMETKEIHLRTHHGVDFEVKLYNSESVTHFWLQKLGSTLQDVWF